MKGDLAARLRAADRADVEEERQRRVRLSQVIADDARLGRLDLGERGADRSANVDDDPVALLQVGGRADGRDALAPDEDLRRGADRERLVLTLAEHRPQGRAVPGFHLHLNRGRARVHELAAKLEEAQAAGRRRARGDGRTGEDDERENRKSTVPHGLVPPWNGTNKTMTLDGQRPISRA